MPVNELNVKGSLADLKPLGSFLNPIKTADQARELAQQLVKREAQAERKRKGQGQ
jgi:hypothetical protein